MRLRAKTRNTTASLLALLIGAGLGLTPRLRAAVRRPPDTPSGLGVEAGAAGTLRQAADYVEWGRLKEARTLLAAAVQQPGESSDAALIAYYGHVLMQFGDMRAGLDLARRAVALDGACASCHLYLFEALAQRAKTVSPMRALLQLPKLRQQLELAGKLNPKLGDVQWGWIDLDLGLPPAAGGSIPDAFTHADRLIEIDPVDGHLARATIAAAAGHPDQALAEYRAAAASKPGDPRGVFALGQALYQRGHYLQAEPYLSQALALNHESALYSGYQAADLVHLQRLEEARQVLAAGTQAHPDSRLGEYLAAQALKDTGQDFAWAKQLVSSYLMVPPEPQQPTFAQGQALLADLG